MYIAKLIN